MINNTNYRTWINAWQRKARQHRTNFPHKPNITCRRLFEGWKFTCKLQVLVGTRACISFEWLCGPNLLPAIFSNKLFNCLLLFFIKNLFRVQNFSCSQFYLHCGPEEEWMKTETLALTTIMQHHVPRIYVLKSRT